MQVNIERKQAAGNTKLEKDKLLQKRIRRKRNKKQKGTKRWETTW